MLIGYARVSTEDQRMDLQIDALRKAGCDDDDFIYKEHASGKTAKRAELQRCLGTLRKGDTLVVYKLDRLGRSMKDLISIVTKLGERGVEFRSLTENIDTTTPAGTFFFHLFGSFAQFERDLISERTKAGLAAARARGRRGGRKRKLSEKQAKLAVKILNEDQSLKHEEVAKGMGVSRATLYRTWDHFGITPPDPLRMMPTNGRQE